MPAAASPSLQNLEELIQAFTFSLDIRETLDATLRRLMDFLHTEAASVFLLDPQSAELVCEACAGPVDLRGLRLPPGTGIVGKAVAEAATQLVRDTRRAPGFYAGVDHASGFDTRSILCAPLLLHGECIGAIELLNKRRAADAIEGLFGEDDRQLLAILASSAALAIHNARLAAELARSRALQRELEIARSIQESFLPAFEANHPIAGINLAAREVSGDFFDYLLLPNGKYVFNIGDVSGKGVEAALLMAKASSLYHCLAKNLESPAAVMSVLNQELCEQSTRGMFVTMIGGLYDPGSGVVTLANAGHPPAIQRSAPGSYQVHDRRGLPLGILPGQRYEESSFALAESSLYLYTDGLSEGLARTLKNRDEMESLKSLIDRFDNEPGLQRLTLVANEVFLQGLRFDDLTILLLEERIRETASTAFA